MRRVANHVLVCVLGALAAAVALGGERVPGEHWMRYVDPAEAGFDATRLEAARAAWEQLPSAAFLVVADGAVVADWGETQRRFMCHSVRKSFMSGLYGIFWDRGEIELNKQLTDLGIDDTPDPLMPGERRARILDLLKARSGVFHPAAYAGRTDSRPRGSEGPGRYFAYNNWDFNTLATILEEQTGERVFEAFDRYFGRPLQMEDWRVSDGYYHYQRDLSRFPAYPFRMSARDAARFGLLYAREGLWGEQRVLSRHWVRRSAVPYSIDSDVWGYGFLWWIARQPRFDRYGMYAALGVGNQMIAVLPDIDVVIVNRANTYLGQGTPSEPLLDLIEQVLAARSGGPVAEPRLEPLTDAPAPAWQTSVAAQRLQPFSGEWPMPPAPLGLPVETTIRIRAADGHLVAYFPQAGTFALYLQPDGSLRAEDSYERFATIADDDGRPAGIADSEMVAGAALAAAAGGGPDASKRSRKLLALAGDDDLGSVALARVAIELLVGEAATARRMAQEQIAQRSPREVETRLNQLGYRLLSTDRDAAAVRVFELNTELFPDQGNPWDSLAEAHMKMGHDEEAVRLYRKSLEIDPGNDNARQKLDELAARQAAAP